jgi:hypothetical protein
MHVSDEENNVLHSLQCKHRDIEGTLKRKRKERDENVKILKSLNSSITELTQI